MKRHAASLLVYLATVAAPAVADGPDQSHRFPVPYSVDPRNAPAEAPPVSPDKTRPNLQVQSIPPPVSKPQIAPIPPNEYRAIQAQEITPIPPNKAPGVIPQAAVAAPSTPPVRKPFFQRSTADIPPPSGNSFIDRFRPRTPSMDSSTVRSQDLARTSPAVDSPPVVSPGRPLLHEKPAHVSDEPYEYLPPEFSGALPNKISSEGHPLIRAAMLTGSFKQNVARFFNEIGYSTPVWTQAPECLDWRVESNYVVQAPSLVQLLDRMTDGYPLKVTIHEISRNVEFQVTQLFRLDCK